MTDRSAVVARIEARLAALEASPLPDEGLFVVGLKDASMVLVIDNLRYRLGPYPAAGVGAAYCSRCPRAADAVRHQLDEMLIRNGAEPHAAVLDARAARQAGIEAALWALDMLRDVAMAA